MLPCYHVCVVVRSFNYFFIISSVQDGTRICKCHCRFEGRTINMVAHPSMVAMSNRDIQMIMSDNEELQRRVQFLERRHNEMQVLYNEAEMEALREDAFAWRFLQNQHEAAAPVVAVAQNDVQNEWQWQRKRQRIR